MYPEVQAQLMQADRLRQLIAAVGLSAYLNSVHIALLSAVCGGVSDAGETTAGSSTQHAIQVCTDQATPSRMLLPAFTNMKV